jgi:KRAB domain-containing zinc finger protein
LVCNICGATLKNTACLKQHMVRLHTGKEKNYVCEICGFKAKVKITLTKHKRIHEEKNLKCLYCDWSGRRKEVLERHIDKQHQGSLLRGIDNYSGLA